MGHVLMVETMGNVDKAVNTCNNLSEQLTRGCLDGLFMEEIFKTNLAEHGIVWRESVITENYIQKIELMCQGYTGQTGQSCWREISQAYYKLVGANLTNLKERCSKANTADGGRACYFRSFDFALTDQRFEKRQVATICTDYINNANYLYECYDWAISGLILTSPKYVNIINDLCNTAPKSFYSSCWQMKKERIKMYTSS